jgi:hypothetical protein
MNRHNPTIARSTVTGSSTKIFEPGNSNQSIPAVVENHSSVAVRLTFSDTGAMPDPEAYSSLAPGCAVEMNPSINIWAYSPSGVNAEVVVTTGIRHVGSIGATSASAEAGTSLSAEAVQLASWAQQKQLLAEILVGLKVALRYMAEWQGEELKESDALEI